jgi:hypothetical protein
MDLELVRNRIPLLENWVMDLGAGAEVALGVDEEVVGAEAGHEGAAHVRVVPPHLPVLLLLLLRQVPGRPHQRVQQSPLSVHPPLLSSRRQETLTLTLEHGVGGGGGDGRTGWTEEKSLLGLFGPIWIRIGFPKSSYLLHPSRHLFLIILLNVLGTFKKSKIIFESIFKNYIIVQIHKKMDTGTFSVFEKIRCILT